MGGGDVGFRLGTEGQEGCTDFVETGVTFKEPPRHLRLPRQTAEIQDGAGVGHRLGPDVGGIDDGDGPTNTGSIWCNRQRAGIRRRIGFGSGPIYIERRVVPRDTFRIVVGHGPLWRRVNICFRSARGFIHSLVTGTLG